VVGQGRVSVWVAGAGEGNTTSNAARQNEENCPKQLNGAAGMARAGGAQTRSAAWGKCSVD